MKTNDPMPKKQSNQVIGFQKSLIGLYGTLYMKQGKESVKAWMYLFTCIAERAYIHLELAKNITPE